MRRSSFKSLAVAVVAGAVLTVPSALASVDAARDIPKPLPTGADGRPQVQAALDALRPGETKLLAVKPAKSDNWYAPYDVDASVVAEPGSNIVGGTFEPDGAAASDQRRGFGCFIDIWQPSYVAPGVIQGTEDFELCVNVARTEADVCIKESSTYSCHAHANRVHYGNSNWTAWSGAWACQNIHRAWETVATNFYVAINGQTSLWGAQSGWSAGFNC